MQILLAGQDITAFCDETKVDIKNTLAQGPGVQGGSTGSSATCDLYTSLGPAASALGAGSSITQPSLVRMGEIIIKDVIGGTNIFGGYVGTLEDVTERTRLYTKISCYDYWQHLDRFFVNRVYNGNGDVYIIKDLLHTYAPWIDTSLLPSVDSYTFSSEVIKNMSVQKAIQKITDITGYSVWIDYNKRIHYIPPLLAPAAPFSVSTTPDFVSSFPHELTKYLVDDTGAINRVTFYGGRKPSPDFTQDISVQVTGTQTLFTIAYYPKTSSDGKYHLKLNGGTDLVLGRVTGDSLTAANKLKKDGGICDALINVTTPGTIQFNVAPAKGTVVTFLYRYELPLIVTIIARDSYNFFGTYLDATITDETVFDPTIAIIRCNTLLAEQKFGLTTAELLVWKPGLSAGQVLTLTNALRGITAQSLIIQQVQPIPLGGGQFRYKISCGAWSLNIVNVVIHQALAAQFVVTQDTVAYQAAVIVQGQDKANITMTTLVKNTLYSAPHYARLTPVGDGHDSYPGFFHL